MKKNKKPFSEEIVQYLMRQIVSGLNYLHKKNILHRDIKLDNILVNFDNEEDRKNRNMMKAKVKIIDFGFARHLEPSQLAYSTLGSPINMDPGILRKLNRMEHSKEYGYDQKADIWSLGTICYEMLIGKNTFNAETMRELISKVERGNYFLPTTISKEAVSFLNGMLQYDLKKRLSAEQLYHHNFLTKDYSKLTRINVKEASDKIVGSQIKINSKNNQSIWVIFETDEDNNLDNIPSNMFDKNGDINENKNKQNKVDENNNNNNNFIVEKDSIKKFDDASIKKEFFESFELMNDDFEADLIVLLDDDGEEHSFEILDTLDYEDKTYYALYPLFEDPQEQVEADGEYYIFEIVEEDGEEQLAEVEDDDLLDELDEIFRERFEALYDGVEDEE